MDMNEIAQENLIELIIEIQNNNYERVKAKINDIQNSGGSINVKDETYGETPLTSAIIGVAGEEHDRLPIIKTLIEKGADVNMKNLEQQTPLLLAVYSKNPEYVKILLEKGADGPDYYILDEARKNAPEIYDILTVPTVPASDIPQELSSAAIVAAVAAPPVEPLLRHTRTSSSSSSSTDGEGISKKRKKSKSKKTKQKNKTKKSKKHNKSKKHKKYKKHKKTRKTKRK